MSADINKSPDQESFIDRLKFVAKATLVGGVAVFAFMNAPEAADSVMDNVKEAVTPDYSGIDPLHLND